MFSFSFLLDDYILYYYFQIHEFIYFTWFSHHKGQFLVTILFSYFFFGFGDPPTYGFSNIHIYSNRSRIWNQGGEKKDKGKDGISLVDVAYRRAKAVKAARKAVDAGKIVKKHVKNPKHPSQTTKSRTDEMQELFKDDMSEKRQKRTLNAGAKKKSAFKSKSR